VCINQFGKITATATTNHVNLEIVAALTLWLRPISASVSSPWPWRLRQSNWPFVRRGLKRNFIFNSNETVRLLGVKQFGRGQFISA
jgi:hypothetical protein